MSSILEILSEDLLGPSGQEEEGMVASYEMDKSTGGLVIIDEEEDAHTYYCTSVLGTLARTHSSPGGVLDIDHVVETACHE
jgi:hypothetical protein